MVTRDVVIVNSVGLHSRPASHFVREAQLYKSNISIEVEDRRVNAKSILGVLSLGIAQGMTITLRAEGPDETAAVERLAAYVASGLEE